MGDADKRRRKLRSIAEYYIWDKPEVQKLCDEFEAEEGKTDMLGSSRSFNYFLSSR